MITRGSTRIVVGCLRICKDDPISRAPPSPACVCLLPSAPAFRSIGCTLSALKSSHGLSRSLRSWRINISRHEEWFIWKFFKKMIAEIFLKTIAGTFGRKLFSNVMLKLLTDKSSKSVNYIVKEQCYKFSVKMVSCQPGALRVTESSIDRSDCSFPFSLLISHVPPVDCRE